MIEWKRKIEQREKGVGKPLWLLFLLFIFIQNEIKMRRDTIYAHKDLLTILTLHLFCIL